MKNLNPKKFIAALLSAISIASFSAVHSVSAEEAGKTAPAIPEDAVEFNGSYYKIYNDRLSWLDAELYCENLGGHLVTVTSQEEQEFIESINNQKKWIGGYRHTGWDNTWYWITGEEWDYTNWGEGEPNNSSNVISNENKASVWPKFWNDLNLNSREQYGFICEWDKYSVEHIFLGDSNGDNTADALDASDILAAYARNQTTGDYGLTEQQIFMSDVNKDNSVNSIDASIVLQYYADVSTNTDNDHLWYFEVTVKE